MVRVMLAHSPCRRTAAEAALRLHSSVQMARRQRAASAAPARPFGLRCARRARLAACQSRERMREQTRKVKAEGKRKGPARLRPPIQSARGLAAAPRLRLRVPRERCLSHGCGLCRVRFPIHCALVRWSLRRGNP